MATVCRVHLTGLWSTRAGAHAGLTVLLRGIVTDVAEADGIYTLSDEDLDRPGAASGVSSK